MAGPQIRPYNVDTDRVDAPEQFRDIPLNVGDIAADTPLQFEQRVLYPSRFPVLQETDTEGNPYIATHKMANSETSLKPGEPPTPIAYPTVVFQGGQLQELDPEAAFQHAMTTGQYRSFDTPELAQMYAEGLYKRSWGKGDAMQSMQQYTGGKP